MSSTPTVNVFFRSHKREIISTANLFILSVPMHAIESAGHKLN